MTKCTICKLGSWTVGLATIVLALAGLLAIPLPTGPVAITLYILLALIALSFLYYQITPCPRCAAVRRDRSQSPR